MVTREAGGATNLQRTQYAYTANDSYRRKLVRTEQEYDGGWVDSWRATYKYDGLGRLGYEQREDWSGSAWEARYTNSQSYDKCGNRATFAKSVASGFESSYGKSMAWVILTMT